MDACVSVCGAATDASMDDILTRYNRWARRAKSEKLDDLVARNMLYINGTAA